MEQFSEINQEEKKEKIKEGVNLVFELNPELAQIGTEKQYSEYLDTIFPESRVKNIFYHGARSEKFDYFDDNKFLADRTRNFGVGVYATPDFSRADKYKRMDGVTLPIIANSINPFITNGEMRHVYEETGTVQYMPSGKKVTDYTNNDSLIDYGDIGVTDFKKINDFLLEYTGPKKDGLPISKEGEYNVPYIREIVLPNSSQVHILGSNQDLKNFKKFVENKEN
jgi:hypothetical protein